ncbi:hypothetical protein SDC9_124043 [bioreactor metagenome]|uniref:Uncharacterized protein n=1 Tax=bioreactor metagenome TaxID=1076179 RepID=A0A645CJC4_9ZZZZ
MRGGWPSPGRHDDVIGARHGVGACAAAEPSEQTLRGAGHGGDAIRSIGGRGQPLAPVRGEQPEGRGAGLVADPVDGPAEDDGGDHRVEVVEPGADRQVDVVDDDLGQPPDHQGRHRDATVAEQHRHRPVGHLVEDLLESSAGGVEVLLDRQAAAPGAGPDAGVAGVRGGIQRDVLAPQGTLDHATDGVGVAGDVGRELGARPAGQGTGGGPVVVGDLDGRPQQFLGGVVEGGAYLGEGRPAWRVGAHRSTITTGTDGEQGSGATAVPAGPSRSARWWRADGRGPGRSRAVLRPGPVAGHP